MAEGAAAAPACFSEDDFYCPVCQEVFKTPVRTANCQHVSRNDAISDTGEMANNQIRQGETSGHPTFKCPLCQEANFTRQRLLDHCNNRHLYQIVPVICPICVSLPWADTNQVTRNLVSHLNLRHRFDYGEFVNLQLDEEAQYQNAVQESCHVNF
ncbi:E3 ubiquitin-protein ligase RNF138 [Lonchura striata]|uniref:E3 ubiquitin-protein ligase RNF138 n=1 Tax=Lonchura striata TaxID=40157 RepID=A0A218UTJ2_9PASE|nr:E3 ubiquitin-protein ligase RNF138 [Lonchura striata domestica]